MQRKKVFESPALSVVKIQSYNGDTLCAINTLSIWVDDTDGEQGGHDPFND